MRYLLVSTAAVMAITGAAALGNAQMDDKKGPGAQGPSPSMQSSPSGGEGTQQQQAPNRAERKGEPSKGAQRGSGKDEPRAAQTERPSGQPSQAQRGGDKQKAEQRQNDQDRKAAQRKGDEDGKSAQRKGDDDRKAAQRKGDDDRKAAERKGDKGDRKSADQRTGDTERQKSAQPGRDRDGKDTANRDRKDGERVQVTEEKRTQVRERLVKEGGRVDRIDRTRINVNINVGTRLPRSVRLHTLPVHIVSFAPAYRGYRYVVLEDETIVIVNPRTYVIVDVLPAGSQRAGRPGHTHLTLSAEDMRFIYRTVPKERRADVRIRLALGAEVPRRVELFEFPHEVVERVPQVRRYRYIVTDHDVVIVDPNDYEVALVINE